MRFRTTDVFLSGAEDTTPHGEAELEGTVVDFSDSGRNPQVFAVVEVVHKQVVIVPIEKLQLIEPAESR